MATLERTPLSRVVAVPPPLPLQAGSRTASLAGVAAVAIASLSLLLRVLYVYHLKYNTDEPQHLHVVWGWVHGLVPYRDVVDNHAPLFYMIWAPLLRLLPEQSSTLPLMRWSMLPLYLGTLACAYRIGKSLFGTRTALWATAVLTVWPPFFAWTLEYRPDQLWMLLWTAALAVAAAGLTRLSRATLFGLLVGTAMAVSMKTSMLLACFLGAMLMTRALAGRERTLTARRRLQLFGAAMGGFLFAPLLVVAWFWHLGALGELYTGVIGHNLNTGMKHRLSPLDKATVFSAIVLIAWGVLRWRLRGKVLRGANRRRLTLVCTAVLTTAGFKVLWPIFTNQDWLPLIPLWVVLFVGWFAIARQAHGDQSTGFFSRFNKLDRAAVAVMLVSLIFSAAVAPYTDRATPYLASIDSACLLTSPTDHVVDAKGELVFRPRATAWVLETLTRATLKNHPELDMIREDVIAKHAMVSDRWLTRFPSRSRRFLVDNFIAVGNVAVAGKQLHLPAPPADQTIKVQIFLPGEYDLVSQSGQVTGTIDGVAANGPIFLTAGEHTVRCEPPTSSNIALVWHPAIAHGMKVTWNQPLIKDKPKKPTNESFDFGN